MTLKVLHYLWSPGMGGISRLVLDLCRTQSQDRDLEVTLLMGRLAGSLLPVIQDAGIPIRHASLNSGADVSPQSLRRLVRIVRGYDLVHLHSFHPGVALSCWIAGSKVLYMEHGTFGLYRRRRIQDYIIHFLKAFYLNYFVDFITFNSNYTKTTAERIYGIKRISHCVVYNGSYIAEECATIDEVDISLRDYCSGHFVVGTAARLTERKHIDRLLAGFAKFNKKKKSVLLIVGDGPERSSLENMAADLDQEGDVRFLGLKKTATPYFRMMDVCVFPSVAEPFGLVAVEALALGKPTIVFADGGGLVEIVEPLEPLDVVADEDSLRKRLAYYFSVRDTGDGKNLSRINYSKKFTIEKMAHNLLIIYNNII